MSVLDLVLTKEEREEQASLRLDERDNQKILFQCIVDEVKLFADAFEKVGVPPRSLERSYPMAWRARYPEKGWVITRRQDKLSYIGISGTPYMIYLKNGKVKSYEVSSYDAVTKCVLSPDVEIFNPDSCLKLREVDGDIFVGFRTVSVARDLAQFINNYDPNKPKEYILSFK